MNKKINLGLIRGMLISEAYKRYDEIMNLPSDERKEEKVRTGIQIFIREPGTRNALYASIYHPSEAAQTFAVEKAVRSYTLGHFASQNSENPEKMQFRGSLTVNINGVLMQASVSGLDADEDVYEAANLLAKIFAMTPLEILNHVVENDGQIPATFKQKNHYLRKLLFTLHV
jgi:hypothetical protein